MFETMQQAYQRILALAKQKCRVCGQRKELVTVCGLCGEKLDPMCKSCWQTYHSPVCFTPERIAAMESDDPDAVPDDEPDPAQTTYYGGFDPNRGQL